MPFIVAVLVASTITIVYLCYVIHQQASTIRQQRWAIAQLIRRAEWLNERMIGHE